MNGVSMVTTIFILLGLLCNFAEMKEVTDGERAYSSVGDVLLKIPDDYNKLSVPARRRIDQRHREGIKKCKADACRAAAAILEDSDDAERGVERGTAQKPTILDLPNSSKVDPADTATSTKSPTIVDHSNSSKVDPADTVAPTVLTISLDDEALEDVEDDEPTVVDVAIQIESIREIDEVEQKIIIDVDLFVHWKDYRLFPENNVTSGKNLTTILSQYGATLMNDTLYRPIWKPDIFIERVVKIWKPELMTSPFSARYISQSSSIIYTTRASVQIDCSMNFEYYPADTQHCILDVRSYLNDEKKMELRWNPPPGAYLVDPDTDDNFDMQLAYVARKKKRTRGITLKGSTYDVLQLKLSMRRRMTYHLLQTYIPSAFLVIITWLSFLIPEELIEGRIGISMTTLLTLTAMFSSVRENTPVVSYVRAIDIWMAYCIFTVFSTLLEFTFFVWLRNYQLAKRAKKLENIILALKGGGENSSIAKRAKDLENKIFELKEDGENSEILKRAMDLENIILNLKEGGENSKERSLVVTPKVDRQTSISEITTKAGEAFEKTAQIFNHFAFWFFVSSFVVFNVSYWSWLVISSQHYRWEVNSTLNGGDNDDFGFLNI